MTKNLNLLVLGGTSAIALSIVKKRLDDCVKYDRNLSVTLVGRDKGKLEVESQHLQSIGVITTMEISDLSGFSDDVFKSGIQYDDVVIAYGSLTDQERAEGDREYREYQIQTNFRSTVEWMEASVQHFLSHGKGNMIVLGSVAGDRGRLSNYIYGTCKGAVEIYAQGLSHRFANKKGINILLVKPGFVDTPMTANIDKKGLLWAQPDKIAHDVICAINKNKRMIYTPWFWRWIMLIIRNVPAFIFEKTKL
ncbi:MAG: SDR family NAD(P)-dependent oxidoreductase [Lentilitoribacter sp.]